MNTYVLIFLITSLTGAGGLALGGALAAAVRNPSGRAVSLLLRFTAGVMLSVVCFDLVGDAAEASDILPVLCWIIIGYLCTYLLNCWIDKQAHHTHSHGGREHEHHGHHHDHGHSREHDRSRHAPGHDNGELCACGHHTLHTAGLVLAAAVALHNVPVGMAIGATFAGTAHGGGGGVLAALIIGLHNIPEGMAVAVPLISGGMGRSRAAGAAALTGAPTVLGALAGFCLGTLGPAALTLALSFASGAMLYVVFGELLPESSLMWRGKAPSLAAVLGIITGMVIVYA